MAMIYCPECGKQVSDKATACPNCGCPVSAIVGEESEKPKPIVTPKANACPKCGEPYALGSTYCLKCHDEKMKAEAVKQTVQPVKTAPKKDSPVATVGCAMLLISLFAFNWLALGSLICGLVDVSINDKKYRHIGGWLCIILGIVVLGAWISFVNGL